MAHKVEVRNHFLFIDGVQVPYLPTPNHSGVMARITSIVDHDTASNPFSPDGDIGWLRMPRAQASAHIIIGWDGKVVQLVPFNVVAWHAGPSRLGARVNYNSFAIGIEHDNPGYMDKIGEGVYQGVCRIDTNQNPTLRVAPAPVQHNAKLVKYWLAYSPAQLEISAQIHLALKAAYPTIDEVVGHWQICPGRKTDTNPLFPLGRMRSLVVGNPSQSAPQKVAEVANDPKVEVGVPAASVPAGYMATSQAQAMMTATPPTGDFFTDITTQLTQLSGYGLAFAGKLLMIVGVLFAMWVAGKYLWIYALKPAWRYFFPAKLDASVMPTDYEPVVANPDEIYAPGEPSPGDGLRVDDGGNR